MCAAAALGVCARKGSEPSRAIAVTTAIPAVERLGTSLTSFIATLPLVRTGPRFGQPPSHFPPSHFDARARDRSQDHGLTRAFLGLDWGGVKAANVANAGVRLQIVLER